MSEREKLAVEKFNELYKDGKYCQFRFIQHCK